MSSGPGYAKDRNHKVTVTPFVGRVVVETPSGEVLADTRSALELREATYPPVYYVPRADTQMTKLERTDYGTFCPFKGRASYFSVPGIDQGTNAVWTYEQPYDEVASIREAVAFYPNRLHVRAEPA